MTAIATRMRGWLPTGLAALVLGGATFVTVAPAQAQYYGPGYRYGPPVERRVVRPYYGRPYYGRPYYGRSYYGRRYYGRGCRVVVTRRINRFGEPVVIRRRICG
jgi:hypothetical protein